MKGKEEECLYGDEANKSLERVVAIMIVIIILQSPLGEPKVKLYKDSDGQLKGDGLCCYLKVCRLLTRP